MNTDNLAMTTSSRKLFHWAHRWSQSKLLWAFPVGTACCEPIMDTPYDMSHDSFVEPFPYYQDADGCDLLVVSGTISKKFVPHLMSLYENLSDQKWVMAIGACAISGGPYKSYSTVHGLDKLFDVDIWVPGCPPEPMAIYQGILSLESKVNHALELDRR